MANRIFLHIGAPKSGTTYLQTVLWSNRENLRRQGLLMPGRRLNDHLLASRAVRNGRPDSPQGRVWRDFVEASDRWDGDVVISHEWFVAAGRDRAQEALRSLGRDRVHLVFTARDFVRQVPAAWQETLKIGRGGSLEQFVEGLGSRTGRWSWRSLDPAVALLPWAEGMEPARVHVVTVPPRDGTRRVLLNRFAQACGFDPSDLDVSTAEVNESMGAEAARWMQRIGPELRAAVRADESDWRVQYRWLRSLVSHEMLVPYGGSRIVVPDDLAAALRERAFATREAIERAGYDVVGDLADLVDGQTQPGGRSPADVADAELLGPAEFLTVRLLERLRAERQRAEAAERRLAAVAAAATGADAGPEPSGERPRRRLRRTGRGLLAAARPGNTRRTRSTGDRPG